MSVIVPLTVGSFYESKRKQHPCLKTLCLPGFLGSALLLSQGGERRKGKERLGVKIKVSKVRAAPHYMRKMSMRP